MECSANGNYEMYKTYERLEWYYLKSINRNIYKYDLWNYEICYSTT